MSTIDEVRRRYESMNRLNFRDRLRVSKNIEYWAIETMNKHGVQWEGELVKGWVPTSKQDDTKLKKDAQAEYKGKYIYSQIKFRQPDSGTDVGIAIYQPYPVEGLEAIRDTIRNKRVEYYDSITARDFKFKGELYCCLDNTWQKLAVLPYKTAVAPLLGKVVGEWLDDPDNMELNKFNRTYYSRKVPGAQLKYKEDSGTGWDGGKRKIICYLPVTLFTANPLAQILPMIDPPDYVLN